VPSYYIQYAKACTRKKVIVLMTDDSDETVNVQLVTEGLARLAKTLVSGMVDGDAVMMLAAALNVPQEVARKTPSRMLRYGDAGDDDPDAI
jgi:NH3-dependent NAD+ synthetase